MDVRAGHPRLQESLRYNWKALQRSKVAFGPNGPWDLNMLSLKNFEKADAQKKQAKKLEREFPYFVTLVSLLASSGFGPYTIFQKIREIDLLPLVKIESIKILKRVELLGADPLIAIAETKDKQASRMFEEFLAGYVSAIQSGGNVENYSKSKMERSFDALDNAEKIDVLTINIVKHNCL